MSQWIDQYISANDWLEWHSALSKTSGVTVNRCRRPCIQSFTLLRWNLSNWRNPLVMCVCDLCSFRTAPFLAWTTSELAAWSLPKRGRRRYLLFCPPRPPACAHARGRGNRSCARFLLFCGQLTVCHMAHLGMSSQRQLKGWENFLHLLVAYSLKNRPIL